MASLDFPSNPTDQQTYTLNGITYQYNAAIGAWLTVVVGSQPVTLAANTQVLYSNNGLISGSSGLVFDNSANTLYANTINVSSNMRVYGNLQVGTGTVTITNDSISAASITVAGSAIPSGNTSNAAFAKANAALANTTGTFAGTLTTTGDITSGGTLQALSTVQSSSGADLSLNANGANRDVIMKVNGTELVRILGSSSRVGIGTSSPSQKAEISDSADTFLRVTGGLNNAKGVEFYRGTGSPTQIYGVGEDLRVFTGGVNSMTIDSSGRVATSYQPRVQAYKTTGGWDSITGYYIFNTAAVNIGNHYNTSTGLFTCPVAGYYKVTAAILIGYASGAQNFSLYKNGSAYSSGGGTYLNAYSTSIHATLGQTWIVSCAVNDTMGIYAVSSGTGIYGPGWNNLTIELVG